VRVVMLSSGGGNPEKRDKPESSAVAGKVETAGYGTTPGGATPSVIRVRGGDLKYSEAERKAVMHSGAAGNVVGETGTATMVAKDIELLLLPPGNHAGPGGSASQVDRVTASGHVSITSQGRRGTGERLVYTGETDEFVLTGTPSNPPTLTDPAKGVVRGTSLIFNSRDDSVSIEGSGRKTTTETVAPK